MFASTRLATCYAVFAMVATAANIGTQEFIVRVYAGAFDVPASIAAGTFVGLAVKYLLDKRYIFYFKTRGVLHDTRTFARYSLMGVATTLVFWVFELGFDFVFGTKDMRYFGGIVGLGLGYLTKYQLDKRYVFRQEVK